MKSGIIFAILVALPAAGATLKPETVQAFDRYVRTTEARLDQQRRTGPFLWVDQSPERLKEARQGKVVIAPVNGKGDIEVPGGLVHDWVGAVFIPGANISRALAWAQNYNHHKDAYKPEVIDSRLLSHSGNDYKMYMRLFKKKVITVVLDTEHDVRYFELDPARWYSRSYSTKISEVEDPGKPSERILPPGDGHGFMWRLDSYWRFQERDGGVYVECEAVSLSRNVPSGLGWLIEPIIRQLPKQSLESTLDSTRKAVMTKTAAAH